MRMIPAVPHGTKSNAEKRVFDKLRQCFEKPRNESLVCYHSLNLTHHAYKRFGEIDFLICGEPGLFVLEVKGGRVSCHNGIWLHTNRYGQTKKSAEGPFRQAESALHGLRKKLQANIPKWVIDQFVMGYAVVFPDCEFSASSVEWDPETFIDSRNFLNFERWLKKLFAHWKNRDHGLRCPDHSSIKQLQNYLRPEFETVIPLYVQTREIQKRVVALTEDQMIMVDVVEANQRVMCSGGAGTGKTFMAMELARRWTSMGMNVVLACRSLWLKRYLEARFDIPGLTTALVESIKTVIFRKCLSSFDAMLVDEGQDLFDIDSLDMLDQVLSGGIDQGRWCFFYDINNQSGIFGPVEQEAMDYLMNQHPVIVPLGINCRNTSPILKTVQTYLKADMGIRGAGEGPEVRMHHAGSSEESALILNKLITELIEDGGISASSLTILSPLSFSESSASLLPHSLKKHILILDEYSMRSFPPGAMSFATIASFKGLENEAIVVIDLPEFQKASSIAMHYVAMSRARAILSLIFMSN